ncbi:MULTISPECIES: hypothetical protein [unclassified Meiothermus]|uniref:hypothetical protein n=1 Tax=unclassified Meiothermus TaxID=370471 RepID=UPI000D7CB87B|nr:MULTISPECIES: hypothetical protein [unclassified Meiothermus]PZA07773.1 hypothetical protein DNA98_05555 [Meiothermus sp. Pnk-1]RYM38927.1 hypothetical protein EWH23_04140 [Meiothermus sp. PNK-Is4]
MRISPDEALEIIANQDGQECLVHFADGEGWRVRYLGLVETPSLASGASAIPGYNHSEVFPLFATWSPSAKCWLEVTQKTMLQALSRRVIVRVEVEPVGA